MYKRLFCSFTFTFLTLLFMTVAVFARHSIVITGIIPDSSGNFVIVNTKNNLNNIENFNVTTLNEPNRAVIDISNALLSIRKKSVKFVNKPVKNVKIAQFSINPNIVRIVFTADSEQTLQKIGVHKSKSALIFKINDVAIQNIKTPVVYKGKNIKKGVNVTAKKHNQQSNNNFVKINNVKIEKYNAQETVNIRPPYPGHHKYPKYKLRPQQNRVLPKLEAQNNGFTREESQNLQVLERHPEPVATTQQPPLILDKIEIKGYEQQENLEKPTPVIIEGKNKEQLIFEPDSNLNIVIKSVDVNQNQVILSGLGNIGVREPFILENPSRVIFDIPNSSLASKNLYKSVRLRNKDVIRVGEVEETITRVVVETKTPENYISIVSPDLQSLIITPKNYTDFSSLPNSKIAAQVEDIKVNRRGENTTIITLVASHPVIHNLSHFLGRDNSILSLFNVNAPDKHWIENLPKTKQFKNLDIEFMKRYPNGSKWHFNINPNTAVETRLSLDGRIIELTLKDTDINSIYPFNAPLSKTKIVLDPGHGGNDPGAERDGIYEKEINLDVARRVAKYLSKAGIKVVMTRNSDKTVSLHDRSTLSNREKPDAFLSIHVNASVNSKIRGIETHWYTPRSKGLAQVVQNNMMSKINTPDRGIKKSRFYVIRHTKAPSVLVEIGFMSNNRERYELLQPERRDITAKSIADAIIKYLSLKYSA